MSPAIVVLVVAAIAGAQGPGESTMADGDIAAISSTVMASFRCTTTSAPSSPRYCTRLYVKES